MLKKKTIRIISTIVAVVLVAAMVLSIIVSGISFAAAADSDDLKDKLTSLEDQKAAVKKELDELQTQVDSTEKTRAALESEISLTKEQIATVEAYIDRLQSQIDVKTGELGVAEDNLSEKEDDFAQTVRTTYEAGDASYLQILLNSSSFSNMLSRMEIISQLMEHNQKVVAEYTAAKEDIEEKRDDLQNTQDEQKNYQENLNYKADELAQSEAEQAALLESLSSYQATKKSEWEKIESDMASVNNQIAQLSRQEAAAANGGSGASYYSGTFTWPLPGYTNNSSAYGWRIHPIYGTRKFHAGEDIPAPGGTPIVAAASGTVTTAGWVSGYGNYTVINHGGGVMTAYGHQSAIQVSVGQTVSAGEQIGLVGTTGNSTGNHLHFEVYINGSTVNPMDDFS